jgi:putative salt-induced outer membrane protein
MSESTIKRAALATALLTIAAFSAPASAQWTGKGQAGISAASGNTDTKTANASVAVAYKADAWEYSGSLAGQYARSAGATSAERWEIGGKARRMFDSGTYWFSGLRYEEDKFSGFDHQGVINTGIGRKFIDNDTTKFWGEAGVGYKFFETLGIPSNKDSSIAGTASLGFEHKISETTTFFDRFSAEVTSDNNFLQNDIGISVKMSDRLALALAYGIRHNTDPPAGFKKTDTLTTVNLVYEVK